MTIIPVIDVKNGVVVHAREGRRADYRPLLSPLCPNGGLVELIGIFSELFAASTLYIADLDAIGLKAGLNRAIRQAMIRFSDIAFWLDQGFQTADRPCSGVANSRPVLGSESYRDGDMPAVTAFNRNFVLSLDFLRNQKLGSAELFERSELWPDTVIVMTLDRVGGKMGPDLPLLHTFCLRYPEKNIVAAGGVRHPDDLRALEAAGVGGVLMASALHAGAVTPEDVAAFNRNPAPADGKGGRVIIPKPANGGRTEKADF